MFAKIIFNEHGDDLQVSLGVVDDWVIVIGSGEVLAVFGGCGMEDVVGGWVEVDIFGVEVEVVVDVVVVVVVAIRVVDLIAYNGGWHLNRLVDFDDCK